METKKNSRAWLSHSVSWLSFVSWLNFVYIRKSRVHLWQSWENRDLVQYHMVSWVLWWHYANLLSEAKQIHWRGNLITWLQLKSFLVRKKKDNDGMLNSWEQSPASVILFLKEKIKSWVYESDMKIWVASKALFQLSIAAKYKIPKHKIMMYDLHILWVKD